MGHHQGNLCLRCSLIWVLLLLEVNRHHQMIQGIGIAMRLLRRDCHENNMMTEDFRRRTREEEDHHEERGHPWTDHLLNRCTIVALILEEDHRQISILHKIERLLHEAIHFQSPTIIMIQEMPLLHSEYTINGRRVVRTDITILESTIEEILPLGIQEYHFAMATSKNY